MTQLEFDIEMMKINSKQETELDSLNGLIDGYRETIDGHYREIVNYKSLIRTIEAQKRCLREETNQKRLELKQRFAEEPDTHERNREDHDPYPEE